MLLSCYSCLFLILNKKRKIIRFFLLSFSSKESNLFIGTNRHELEVRSFPTGDCLPSLIHLTQPVSTLCLDKSFLFVGTRFDKKKILMFVFLFK